MCMQMLSNWWVPYTHKYKTEILREADAIDLKIKLAGLTVSSSNSSNKLTQSSTRGFNTLVTSISLMELLVMAFVTALMASRDGSLNPGSGLPLMISILMASKSLVPTANISLGGYTEAHAVMVSNESFFALPDVVDIFCSNNGNANSENRGVEAIHCLRFNLRSLAVIPYGLSGGGRNVMGK